MLRHIAVFKWADCTGEDRVGALSAALSHLPTAIPELRHYRFGTDARLVEGNWDYAVVADFDDAGGWRAYLDHPDHRAVLETHIRPMIGERAAVQFTYEP